MNLEGPGRDVQVGRQPPYPEEFRKHSIALYRAGGGRCTYAALAAELGITGETLRTWVRVDTAEHTSEWAEPARVRLRSWLGCGRRTPGCSGRRGSGRWSARCRVGWPGARSGWPSAGVDRLGNASSLGRRHGWRGRRGRRGLGEGGWRFHKGDSSAVGGAAIAGRRPSASDGGRQRKALLGLPVISSVSNRCR
jgi:hypothetical protein